MNTTDHQLAALDGRDAAIEGLRPENAALRKRIRAARDAVRWFSDARDFDDGHPAVARLSAALDLRRPLPPKGKRR